MRQSAFIGQLAILGKHNTITTIVIITRSATSHKLIRIPTQRDFTTTRDDISSIARSVMCLITIVVIIIENVVVIVIIIIVIVVEGAKLL